MANRSDLKPEMLEKTRQLMNSHVRDCLVENYQELIPILSLPDPNDRHVLAAGIHAKCSVIVTYNIKDFPRKTLDQYGIEAQHPDEFIIHLIDLAPEKTCIAAKGHRLSLKNPPKTIDEYLETLEKHSLNQTVVQLKLLRDFK